MKHILLSCVLGFTIMLTNQAQSQASQDNPSEMNYGRLSEQFVEALRDGKDAASIIQTLEDADVDDLKRALKTDIQKRAFWMNVYNAYIQYFLGKNPELYDDRGAFFTNKRMKVAGRELSFDDIEHGIIRGSRNKLSLGYIKKIFVSSYERKLRVSGKDGRVHFSLNCGAKSCPPVAVFKAEKLDSQMDALSEAYLKKFSVYEADKNEVGTTSLMSWFRADFGGLKGVMKYLKKYGVVPENADPDIKFLPYDWTLYLGNYSDL